MAHSDGQRQATHGLPEGTDGQREGAGRLRAEQPVAGEFANIYTSCRG